MTATPDHPEPTEKQLETMRHMLGIGDRYRRTPQPYRNYYDTGLTPDPDIEALVASGYVEKMDSKLLGGLYRCTPKGRIAAMDSFRPHPKSRRVYHAYLSARDAFDNLTFRDFLTHPDFAETRRNA